MSENKVFDVVIVGGGPVGLFGLFYTCLRQMDAMIIDSLPELGGQLVALYPEKDVYDVAGFPCIRAKELAEQFIKQAIMHKKQEILLGERIEKLERDAEKNIINLVSSSGRKILTRTVVITTGAGAFAPNKLPCPGVDVLEGKSLHYFVRNKSIFAGKRVVIVGGGDSAFDWILNLHPIAKSIVMVHRRDVFRAHEDTVAKVDALTDVPKYLFYEVKGFQCNEDGTLREVTIVNNKTDESVTLEADELVSNLGFVADIGPLKTWGLELKANNIIVNQRMETNIPGVYAAGDAAWFPGKLKLIATGTGEAATAVNAAKHFIDPAEREQPIHSSTLFEKTKPVVPA